MRGEILGVERHREVTHNVKTKHYPKMVTIS